MDIVLYSSHSGFVETCIHIDETIENLGKYLLPPKDVIRGVIILGKVYHIDKYNSSKLIDFNVIDGMHIQVLTGEPCDPNEIADCKTFTLDECINLHEGIVKAHPKNTFNDIPNKIPKNELNRFPKNELNNFPKTELKKPQKIEPELDVIDIPKNKLKPKDERNLQNIKNVFESIDMDIIKQIYFENKKNMDAVTEQLLIMVAC